MCAADPQPIGAAVPSEPLPPEADSWLETVDDAVAEYVDADTPEEVAVEPADADAEVAAEVTVEEIICRADDTHAALDFLASLSSSSRPSAQTNGNGTPRNRNGRSRHTAVLPKIDDARLAEFETAIGYCFLDRALLRRALTHSSSTSDKGHDNERMEFFGDAVLDLVIREHLYHAYPNQQEGELTEVKSAIVRKQTLARAGKRLGLSPYLILGRGVGRRTGLPESLYANTFEALVAAFYLDGGYQPAKTFILASLAGEIAEAIRLAHHQNYKSLLQQKLQQNGRKPPVYRVLATSGPEHARTFEMAAIVEGSEMGRGRGSCKKDAEQEAARAALQVIDVPDARAEERESRTES